MIYKVGFYTSIISYLIFWLTDAVRPGFVARYFSVHVFLLSAIIFGLIWLILNSGKKNIRLLQHAVAALFGILGFVISWKLGKGFEEYRVLVAILAGILPIVVLRLLRG